MIMPVSPQPRTSDAGGDETRANHAPARVMMRFGERREFIFRNFWCLPLAVFAGLLLARGSFAHGQVENFSQMEWPPIALLNDLLMATEPIGDDERIPIGVPHSR